MPIAILILGLIGAGAFAQDDPGKQLNKLLAEKTGKRLQFSFEFRQRLEDRTGQVFGRDRDLAADYIRLRFGASLKPVSWLKLSALAQDTRAPLYGLPAPGNVKDPLDLQEGYIEMFAASQRGVGMTVGRQMINYGDTRLIGSPQWAYTARTWDTARLYYVTKKTKFEFFSLSPIVPRGTEFNRPVLGDRIWGTYNTFREVVGKTVIDAYALRHDQNRPGGFTGVGSLGINVFGSRWAVPLPRNFRFTAEGVLQGGHVGPLTHRAQGFAGQVGYKTSMAGKPVDLANEYKYASGTDPSSGKDGTFDQLYPAAHDKLGHIDLIGWKNIHNIRSMTTLTARKGWNVVLMYNASWLADTRDALYNAQGRAIVRSAAGTAGRWVGQELDLYTNYQVWGMSLGAGIGQFFPGTFVRNMTPGARSRLLYLSTGYSF
ncbi:MAG: alginate export family protein [Acidobacteria bacterium]|nr:alginate export family protein [Acidobacteriota bacterium]